MSYSDGHSRANEQEVTRQIARGEKKSTLLIVGIFYNKTKCKIQILRGYDIKIARDSRNVTVSMVTIPFQDYSDLTIKTTFIVMNCNCESKWFCRGKCRLDVKAE